MPVNAVEAELAERLAEQLRNALEAIASLTRRRGDYLADGVKASAAIRTVLEEYKASRERPASDDRSNVHVLLGGRFQIGQMPTTFTFGTRDESLAFVEGMQALGESGSIDFCLCEHANEVVCADGEVRRLPAGVNPEGPVVVYSMHTADDCVKHSYYGLGDNAQLVEIDPGEWSPSGPDLETISVDIEIHHARDDQEQADLSRRSAPRPRRRRCAARLPGAARQTRS